MKIRSLIFSTMLILSSGCNWNNKTSTAKVSFSQYSNNWSGLARLEPAKVTYVTSPSGGYITSFGLGFGREIAAGDKLVEISDPKIQDDFNTTVIDFIKSKDKIKHEQQKLKGEKEMLSAGILSADEYWTQKSSAQDAFISYIRNKLKLEEIAKLVGIPFNQLVKVTADDKEKILELMSKKVTVKIAASQPGLLLPRNIVTNDDSKPLSLGAKIDKGEIIAAIAEQGSFKVKVMLPDSFSRKISKTTKAVIKGELGLSLDAVVSDFQPYMYQENSGKRVFPATISINMPKPPKLVPEVYVGMPVEVSIILKKESSIRVPIGAIGYSKGRYYVDKVNTFSNDRIFVEVLSTDEHFAYIRGRLTKNDEVVVHD